MSERYSTEGPVCPHCGHCDTPDEGFYYDEDTTSLECGECCLGYDVRVFNSTSWTTSLPALSEHQSLPLRGDTNG